MRGPLLNPRPSSRGVDGGATSNDRFYDRHIFTLGKSDLFLAETDAPRRLAIPSDDLLSRSPMTGIAEYCAFAAIGQAAALRRAP